MSWVCRLTRDAEKDLSKLPHDVRERVAHVVSSMEADPFMGDVKPLKGKEWKGVFRRRLGSYRIIFAVHHATKTVTVVRILSRSEKTYR